jgi:hypothetical protein
LASAARLSLSYIDIVDGQFRMEGEGKALLRATLEAWCPQHALYSQAKGLA